MLTTEERFQRINKWRNNLSTGAFLETRERQWKKLSCLLVEREAKTGHDGGHYLDQRKIVINMSKRALSNSEESILPLGLNFVPAPTSIPELNIIVETEATA